MLGIVMCRSIKRLRTAGPPSTPQEIRAAALQFVRKVSGFHHPSAAHDAAFQQAVSEIALATETLLASLPALRNRVPAAAEPAGPE